MRVSFGGALSVGMSAVALLIGGCSQLLSETMPKCSDEAPLDLVRQIILETGTEKDLAKLDPALLRRVLTFELPHATRREENIKKYSCEARLATPELPNSGQVPVSYSVQLDDDDQLLVSVDDVNFMLIGVAYAAVHAAQKADAPAASVAPAAVSQEASAPDTTEPQSVEQSAAPELAASSEPTAEQIADIDVKRKVILDDPELPQFGDYPADVYSGPAAALVMDSETARSYRTRFRDVLGDAPSFAGDYVQATWGCGTSCAVQNWVNKRTGHAAEWGCCGGEFGPWLRAAHADSRLLIAEGPEMKDLEMVGDDNRLFFYVEEGGDLKLIKTVHIPRQANADSSGMPVD